MNPVYFLGFLVWIQNVYPYETQLGDVFRVVESWIFIHGFEPTTLRIICGDWVMVCLLCYLWETWEVSWFVVKKISSYFGNNFVYNTASWLGSELPSDNLIGDPGQGAVCSLWASYFMWINDVPTLYQWYYRTWRQRAWRLFLVVIQSHSSLVAIVMLVRDPSKPIYYSSIAEWWNSPLNLVPIGWFFYLALRLLLLFHQKMEDKLFCHSRGDFHLIDRFGRYYDCLIEYFLVEAIFCSTFIVPTFYAYYTGQVVLMILFYYRHRDLRAKKEWKTFLPYLSIFFDPDIAALVIAKTSPKQSPDRI